jgi:hypothetical protein
MEDSTNNIKQCPYCGEDIHINAVKCPYCRTWIDGRDSNSSPLPTSEKPQNAAPVSRQSGLDDYLDSVAVHVTHAGRRRPTEITLFPLLIDGDAAVTAVSGSLRYRECLIGLSARIETSHARLVS